MRSPSISGDASGPLSDELFTLYSALKFRSAGHSPLNSSDFNLPLHSQPSSPFLFSVPCRAMGSISSDSSRGPPTPVEFSMSRSAYRDRLRDSLQSSTSTPLYPASTQTSTPLDRARGGERRGYVHRARDSRSGKRRAPATPEPHVRQVTDAAAGLPNPIYDSSTNTLVGDSSQSSEIDLIIWNLVSR